MAVFGNISAFYNDALAGYGDTYIVTDLRKRARKEPNEVKSLKSFEWKIDKKAPKTEPEPKAQESAPEKNINDIVNDLVSRGYERVENVVEEIEKNPNQIFIVPLPDNKLRYIRLFEKTGNIYRFEYVNENRTTKPKLYEYQLKDIKHWLKSPEKTETAPVESNEPTPEPEPAQESAPESAAPENEIFNDAETVEIENTPVKNAAEPNWSAIEKDMARAKYWSSFDPEKSAKFETDYYKAVYNEVLKDVPADYVDRFNDIFNRKVYELISLQSKAPNAAVTGSGGVSASKARKYNAANDRLFETRAKFDDYMKYIARRLAANARRKEFIESTPEQRENAEFERLKPEVEGFIKTKALLEVIKKDPAKYMKDNNIPLPRYYADATDYYNHLLYDYQLGKATFYDKLERVADKGYYNAVSQILDLLRGKDVYTDKHKIFTLIDRAKKWNARKSESFYDKNFSYDGVKIVNNETLDRLQIFFDTIPADDVRTDLKANGFRWSPREKAWQRQYNSNAIIAAKRVLDKHFKKEGLGKPTIKFEFNNNDELKAFLNDNKENLIDSYIDADIADESALTPVKGLAGNIPAEIYNNNDIIVCGGMRPTYKILPSYAHFFEPANALESFAGFGLTDTKKLIADYCRKYWKDCAKIAKHLKADSLLQSCFNLWYWMRHNIKYAYDAEGKEEVRSPRRVWQDRMQGVDCDCLSVFAWCVLTCMGYDPIFELVAFNGKKAPSHIFVSCNGVVVDRVWFIFNQRPPQITSREIYRVNLLDNLGKLF